MYTKDVIETAFLLIDTMREQLKKSEEENENLLKSLIGLVDQIENEQCSEYIDELQERAKKVIEKAQR